MQTLSLLNDLTLYVLLIEVKKRSGFFYFILALKMRAHFVFAGWWLLLYLNYLLPAYGILLKPDRLNRLYLVMF